MGYETYEEPMVNGVIYYYNACEFSSLYFCKRILLAFKKHGYDDITNIKLGKQEIAGGILKDYVVQYTKKELSMFNLEVELFNWVNDDNVTSVSFVHKEKKRWMWDLTWYKDYKFPDNTSVSDYTFNYLSLLNSYNSLDDKNAQIKYVELFCELSDLFGAFYGRIEDVSTAVDILERTKEKSFNHKRIQSIYWGNYLGRDFMEKMNKKRLFDTPCQIVQYTNNGVFFALTNNINDSLANPDYPNRKKIYKLLF